ncbi:MAG TPA: DUF4097 family beta strand repeat-containing protein [Pyrinomonadaceae bacterium]|nr:DUF4097 family beta strand repeat-containing protein [Pyrinomonadaceae bacterium]
MAERCKNCGAELFAGQQFCRSCGTPTYERTSGEMPTQILTPSGQSSGAPPTAPIPGGATDSVSQTRATSYYPPHATAHVTQGPPPARRKKRGWLLAFAIIAVMGATTLAALLYAVSVRREQMRGRVVKIVHTGKPDVPPVPPVPAIEPVVPETANEARLGMLDEAGADVSDDETVITKTYPLGEGASVSLKNTSGRIRVEGWDEPRVELRIIKHGGSEAERRAVAIKLSHEEDALRLSTASSVSGRVEVRYELKLPHTLRQLEISSTNSDVKLADLSGGEIVVRLQRGNIELTGVGGAVVTSTIKGNTKVELGEAEQDGRASSSLTSVSGDIELRLPEGLDADIKAETINGDIEVDEALGLTVQKMLAGKHAAGRIGEGGKSIHLKAVSGDIRIKQ